MGKVYGVLLLLGSFLLVAFQNCAEQSSFEGFGPSVVPISDGLSSGINQFEGLRVLNSEVYLNCFEDHVQIGGVCNTGGSSHNFIRYWMTYNGARVFWGVPPNQVDQLEGSRCENGRWTAIVPKPNTGVLSAGTSYLEFEVHFQIYLQELNSSQYKAGSQAPAYTISIQQAGACL